MEIMYSSVHSPLSVILPIQLTLTQTPYPPTFGAYQINPLSLKLISSHSVYALLPHLFFITPSPNLYIYTSLKNPQNSSKPNTGRHYHSGACWSQTSFRDDHLALQCRAQRSRHSDNKGGEHWSTQIQLGRPERSSLHKTVSGARKAVMYAIRSTGQRWT